MNFFDIIGLLAVGVGQTLLVTLACSATGMFIGMTAAGLRRIDFFGAKFLLNFYSFVFRGIPVLVLLFLVYFGLPGMGFKVPPLLAMMLSLGLISGAYLAEVFRGALDSVDGAEVLAAEAMGMSRLQVLIYIELPQMLRFAVPGMVNEFTTVLKYSPFAYTVGIPEITKQAMTLASTTLRGIEVYLAVGILYFAIYRTLLLGVQWLSFKYRVPGFGAR